jgi:dolichol kinase
MALRREEVMRKVLHVIFGAVIPAGILYIPSYAATLTWLPKEIPAQLYPTLILAVCLVGFVVGEFLRLRVAAVQGIVHKAIGSMLRHEEAKRVTGATWINASALLCSIIFYNAPYISAMVLSLFIWGDAAAALVGQSIGKTKIGKKSLEGSLACLALCVCMFFFIFPYIPHMLDTWNNHIPVAIVCIVSLCITVMELIPIRIGAHVTINDNLIVPVVSGIVMQVIYPLLK